jgi:hypothetical protein
MYRFEEFGQPKRLRLCGKAALAPMGYFDCEADQSGTEYRHA